MLMALVILSLCSRELHFNHLTSAHSGGRENRREDSTPSVAQRLTEDEHQQQQHFAAMNRREHSTGYRWPLARHTKVIQCECECVFVCVCVWCRSSSAPCSDAGANIFFSSLLSFFFFSSTPSSSSSLRFAS